MASSINRFECVICKEMHNGYGDNAQPVKDGHCCSKCNYGHVIPARIYSGKLIFDCNKESVETEFMRESEVDHVHEDSVKPDERVVVTCGSYCVGEQGVLVFHVHSYYGSYSGLFKMDNPPTWSKDWMVWLPYEDLRVIVKGLGRQGV